MQIDHTCSDAAQMKGFCKAMSPQARKMMRAALESADADSGTDETAEDDAWPMDEDDPKRAKPRMAPKRSSGPSKPMSY